MTDVSAIAQTAVQGAAEVLTVTGEVIKSASWLARAQGVASAHPIAAALTGVAVAGVAVYGGVKLTKKLMGLRKKPVAVAAPVVVPAAPVDPTVTA